MADLEAVVETAGTNHRSSQFDCSFEDVETDHGCVGNDFGERRAKFSDTGADVEESATVAEALGEPVKAGDCDRGEHPSAERRRSPLGEQGLVVMGRPAHRIHVGEDPGDGCDLSQHRDRGLGADRRRDHLHQLDHARCRLVPGSDLGQQADRSQDTGRGGVVGGCQPHTVGLDRARSAELGDSGECPRRLFQRSDRRRRVPCTGSGSGGRLAIGFVVCSGGG